MMIPRRAYFLGIIILAGLFLYSGQSLAFSTHNTTLTRSFNKLQVVAGGSIRVTVSFSNLETSSLRGFYYSDHIPEDLFVTTQSVTINGSPVSSYSYESSASGQVWTGCVTHRWILETPADFSENNPVLSGGTARIIYTLSSKQSGTFALNEFNWAGYFPSHLAPAFGHSRDEDQQEINIYKTISGIQAPEPVYNDKQKSEMIFNWLESLFPEILSPSAQPTRFANGVYYRSYSDTQVMIGTYMEDLYYLDQHGDVHNLGKIDQWLEQVPDEIVDLTYKDKLQSEIIFNWLESLFPEILSLSAQPTRFANGVYYRSYSDTQVMLGTYKEELYYLDQHGKVHNLGKIDQWLEQVPNEIVSFEYAYAPLSDQMGIDQALEIQKRLIHASILYKEAMIWTGEALWGDPADISHFQWNNVTLEAISLLELAEKSSALLYASAGSFSPQLSILAEQMAVDVRKANYLLGMVQSMIDHQTWSDQRQTSNILEQAALSLKQACRVTLVSGAAVMTGGNSTTLVKLSKAGASAVQGVELVVEIGQNASRLAFGEYDNLTVLLEYSRNIAGPPEKFISVSSLITDPVDDDNLIYSGKRLIDIIYGSGSKSMVRTSEGYNGLNISNPIMEMYADRYDDLAFVLEDYLNEQEYELLEIIKGLAEKIDHANAYEIPMSTRPLQRADQAILAGIKDSLSEYHIDPDDYFNSLHEEINSWLGQIFN